MDKEYTLIDWLGEFFQPFTTEAYIRNLTDPVKKKRMTLLYNESRRLRASLESAIREYATGNLKVDVSLCEEKINNLTATLSVMSGKL